MHLLPMRFEALLNLREDFLCGREIPRIKRLVQGCEWARDRTASRLRLDQGCEVLLRLAHIASL